MVEVLCASYKKKQLNWESSPHEPKKMALRSMKYWLFTRDPYMYNAL